MKNLSRYYRRNLISGSGEIDEGCPDAGLLEYILLTAHHNRELYQQFERHFLVCETCQRRIHLIELFYVILDQEMRQPVSPVVVDFAQRLAATQRTKPAS
ncbi:MAG: hypothetical protein ONB42_21150 [candidate division KSB1 bacterium]|nr:hypothetical protein [candidate division KSB1 bacterium]